MPQEYNHTQGHPQTGNQNFRGGRGGKNHRGRGGYGAIVDRPTNNVYPIEPLRNTITQSADTHA